MFLYNYHTHNQLCRHAVGNTEDYVRRAIELGYSAIGISDHAPLTEEVKEQIGFTRRMTMDELKEKYYPELEEAINKYHDKIEILKSLEAEYYSEMKDVYKAWLDEGFDYLVLGQHYIKINHKIHSVYEKGLTINDMKNYANDVIEALDTGMFKILAHPDLFLWNLKWSKEAEEISRRIIESAIKNDVYLEINANGIRNSKLKERFYTDEENDKVYAYPNKYFMKLLATYPEAKVIVGEDVHDPKFLRDDATVEAYQLAEKYGIKLCEHPIIK